MPNNLMKQLAQCDGSCCIRKYLEVKKDMRTADLADHLGITTRALRYWRRRFRRGELTCDENSECQGAGSTPTSTPLPSDG